MVYRLMKSQCWFPDPRGIPESEREPDGFYAIGGDLRPERLIEAYSQGIFPWSAFRQRQLEWYCPMRRFVIFPDEIHISHSLRTTLNKGKYTVTYNTAFKEVIEMCSLLRINSYGAWLGPEMVEAYTRLHKLGVAHSVEVRHGGEMAGGLYGVALGGAFFGESMFSLMPDASKVALVWLARKMSAEGGKFIDCQFETPHLKSMGGRFISYDEYMDILYDNSGAPQTNRTP